MRPQYFALAYEQMPRLFSRMDRERLSKTYGSFDRTYWGWKFTDFPGARFQEALYAVSWMYVHEKDTNDFYHKSQLLAWIIAGFDNWCSLQYADGSFDEAYPFERSLAATAFTCFYLGEAFLLIENDLHGEDLRKIIETFRLAGNWLCANDEYHGVLSNHLAVAAAALLIINRIIKDDVYFQRSQYFINRILSRQSSEGWYEEYGGVDFGYQTHGIFYLARIWSITNDDTLLESLKRSIVFLSFFLHPNGTLGGEYGSRNTSFYFPAGFEILAPVCSEAASIAAFMRSSVARQKAVGLAMMDAYNLCPLLNNYLFAHDAAKKLRNATSLPFTGVGHWMFPKAGILVHVTEKYQAVFAPSKGGVIKIYDKLSAKLAFSDCGYWVDLKDKSKASSQSFSLNNEFKMDSSDCFVIAPFVRVNQNVMNPWLFIAFRLFTLTVGRFNKVALKVKSLLVNVLVQRRRKVELLLERSIKFDPDKVSIRDKIINCAPDKIPGKFYIGSKFSTIHMGSARYFQKDELDFVDIDAETPVKRTYIWKASK